MLSPAASASPNVKTSPPSQASFHNKAMQLGIGDAQRSPGAGAGCFQSAFAVGTHGKPFRMLFAVLGPPVRDARDHMRAEEAARILDLSHPAVPAMVDFHRFAIGKSRLCRRKHQLTDKFFRQSSHLIIAAALFFQSNSPSTRSAASPNHQDCDRAAAA